MSSLFQGVAHAALYSKFRPTPPDALIDHVMSYLKSTIQPPFKRAVDVGCGTGQSTIILAPHFQTVIGVDVSEAQIENAKQERGAANIIYRVCNAVRTDLEDSSVELVAVSQSMHWFNFDDFFKETKRILVPNGVVAIYGYWIPFPKLEDEHKSQQLVHLIENYLHDDVLGKYWDVRRNILRHDYRDVVLPFSNIVKQKFVKQSTSTLSEYIGYLSTWSALEMLRKESPKQAADLLQNVEERIMQIIGAKTSHDISVLPIHTDYILLMGRNSTEEPMRT